MGVSKVVLGDETLIDLTKDTVSENTLLAGETAHNAAGEEIQGGVVVVPTYFGTKEAIETAIAAGEIPDGSLVNITDDEEKSSFQQQIDTLSDKIIKVDTFLKIGYIPSTLTLEEWLNENLNESNVPQDNRYHNFLISTSQGNYIVKAISIGSSKNYSGTIHPSVGASSKNSYQFSKRTGGAVELKKYGSLDLSDLSTVLLWSGSVISGGTINLSNDMSTFKEIVFYLNSGIALSYKTIRPYSTLIKASNIITSDSGTVPLMFTITLTKNSNTEFVVKAITAYQLSSGMWSEISIENYKLSQVYGII